MSNATFTDRFGASGAVAALDADAKLLESIPADQFRLAFRNHAAGVAVITADAGDGPVAMTATSVISVSATPKKIVIELPFT